MPMLRIVVADDERPARSFLIAQLRAFKDASVVAEASSGRDAVAAIEKERPDLALLDLQMPELDGFDVIRLLKKDAMPLVAFVTAHDEYAVRAFDVNAIDYLLKPVDKTRLRQTLNRAQERLEHAEVAAADKARVTGIAAHRAVAQGRPFLEHVPVRQRDTILLLPVSHVAAIIADGELLHLHTLTNDRHTITYRLKDLEVRLDPTTFVRLSRGTLVRITAIAKIHVMPGGTHLAVLTNGQRLPVSRLQSRIIRDKLLRL